MKPLPRKRFVEQVMPVAVNHGSAHPLTPKQAKHLFDELAAQPQIPFDYPFDCCFSRAHEMCRIMKERGVPCRKVWNYGHNYPPFSHNPLNPPQDPSGPTDTLSVDTPRHPYDENGHPVDHVNWVYHVAPVVKVQGPHGAAQDMVMDPSIFHHPVTVDEWVKVQHDPRSRHEITDSKYYYREPGDRNVALDDDNSKTKAQLRDHVNDRERRKAIHNHNAHSGHH